MNQTAADELNELDHLLSRLELDEWDRAEFRRHSVHYGVYTERQTDRYFVRLRVALGIISAAQLRTLAAAANTWVPGECHLTTRQGVEVHGLAINQILPLLRCLAKVGLFSHETGGNSVRSIMVCPHAGVGREEPFDVTNHAALLTECFLRHPEFQTLPRKMKIGFSCCEDDCARTAVQDLGFQARNGPQGEPGFRVLVGGGTGALPRLAQELLDFLPAGHVAVFTEAFLRTFNRLGDRTNRHRARVKFLVQRIGLNQLRGEIQHELDLLQREGRSYPAPAPVEHGSAVSSFCEGELAETPAGEPPDAEHSRVWIATQTEPQQQAGFNTARLSLRGGLITATQLSELADIVERFALGVRLTPEQDFLLRWVPADRMREIHDSLTQARLLQDLAVRHLVACPGSSACSNAFTNAPGLAKAIEARLAALPDAGSVVRELSIRLSGCTNGCALHATADIGLEGLASRVGDEWFPAYRVWIGGTQNQQRPRFGADLGMVPARNVPNCVVELVRHYLQNHEPGESLADMVERLGAAPSEAVVRTFQIDQAPDRRSLMVDWGETSAYRPRMAKATGVC